MVSPKNVVHTFCAKTYGPVAAQATCYLPAEAAAHLLYFYYVSVSMLTYFPLPSLCAKTVLPKGQTSPAHINPRLKDGGWGNHVVSPGKCFCILFAPKSMGRSRPKRHAICLPGQLHVYSNSILISVPTLFSRPAPQIRPKTVLPKGRAFPAHPCPRPKDGVWGNHVVFPRKMFLHTFAPKSMGPSRPKRHAICLPGRLHVYSNSILISVPSFFLLHHESATELLAQPGICRNKKAAMQPVCCLAAF